MPGSMQHFDNGDGVGKFGYVDGMVASVPDRKSPGLQLARTRSQDGRVVVSGEGCDCASLMVGASDVPAGKVTDFKRAVQAKDGETVVCGWIEWPDKSTRDAGRSTLMHDPRMRDTPPVWDGRLAIFGGFVPILDTARA